MKTIFLIDAMYDGHHPTYFKFFAKTLLELGYKVISLYPKPAELKKWISYNCPSFADKIHIFEFSGQGNQFPIRKLTAFFKRWRFLVAAKRTVYNLKLWRSTAAAIRTIISKIQIYPDLVFFASLDNYLGHYITPAIIDSIFQYDWSGLYLLPSRLRVRQPSSKIFNSFLNIRVVFKSHHCKAVAVLNEGVAEKLQNKIKKPVIIFPDVTDESPPNPDFSIAKQIRKKAGRRKTITLLGALRKQKGFLTLLKVAAETAAKKDWFFVFAGEIPEQTFLPHELTKIKTIVAQNPSNCFFHLKHIPDGPKFNALVNLCDILFAAYENFPHSSSILTKAAIFKKPVIVSKEYCMEERARNFGLGLSIDSGNVPQCIDAIHRLCKDPKTNILQIEANFEGYKRIHSTKQLSKAFKKLLESLN